ncbi:hypothetical protein GCM10023321_72620 [Pseudonocardia eucalypti]|uniref:Uncharacterized protein n=1 Tax=Pseudonocardia eucalypti TaxID=648755 RepID=A0ABP9R7W4_9PSEU
MADCRTNADAMQMECSAGADVPADEAGRPPRDSCRRPGAQRCAWSKGAALLLHYFCIAGTPCHPFVSPGGGGCVHSICIRRRSRNDSLTTSRPSRDTVASL